MTTVLESLVFIKSLYLNQYCRHFFSAICHNSTSGQLPCLALDQQSKPYYILKRGGRRSGPLRRMPRTYVVDEEEETPEAPGGNTRTQAHKSIKE